MNVTVWNGITKPPLKAKPRANDEVKAKQTPQRPKVDRIYEVLEFKEFHE